jgi:hypothetical protein
MVRARMTTSFFASFPTPSALSLAVDLPGWKVGGTGKPWGKTPSSGRRTRSCRSCRDRSAHSRNSSWPMWILTRRGLSSACSRYPALRALELNEPPAFSSAQLVDALMTHSSLTSGSSLPVPGEALVPMLKRLKWRGRLWFCDDRGI